MAAAATVKNTVEQFTAASNVAFKDGVQKRLAAMNQRLFPLPDTQRQLLHLHYVEKHTSQAIAETQGRTRSAVAVSIHRICQRMRRDLTINEADDDLLVINKHSMVKPTL